MLSAGTDDTLDDRTLDVVMAIRLLERQQAPVKITKALREWFQSGMVEDNIKSENELKTNPKEAPDASEKQLIEEKVTVLGLSGDILATVIPVPADVLELKKRLQDIIGVPAGLQKILEAGTNNLMQNLQVLPGRCWEVSMIVDETPLYTWDVQANPEKESLDIDGTTVSCTRLRTDYTNVLTQEPIQSGRHYFQFVMHQIGDEQWCGLTADSSQAGRKVGGRSLKQSWTYYCGRMGSRSNSITDGHGALHADSWAVVEFKTLKPSGDVIGMLVDFDKLAVAFDLNGEFQGACAVIKGPLWVLTHLDDSRDKVELLKPAVASAPEASLDALTGPLLIPSSSSEKLYSYDGFSLFD